MGDQTRVPPGLARALQIAGVLVVAWGMLLLLTLGLTTIGIAFTVFFFFYGVAIIDANRRAVALGWNATALMGVAVFVDGFEPLLVLVWSWFFALSMFLTDSRERLRAGYGRDTAALGSVRTQRLRHLLPPVFPASKY